MASLASTTTAAATRPRKFRYLSAWFCPFAHRCTLALEHHSNNVQYEWVEALGWCQQDDTKNNTAGGGNKEWYYHWKADELKRACPSGLVPTLIPVDENSGKPDESRAVWESLVTVEYVDAVSGATGDHRLIPEDPYLAAQCRIWADKVNKECCSPYYGVLVRQDPREQKEHFNTLVAGLKAFSQQLEKTDGPLFLPNAQLSSVDVALIPWAYRYYVFENYRGPEYRIPTEKNSLQAYQRWYEHVMGLESVQRTLPNRDQYLDHIAKYANGTARSKVANAVRRGVAAHELDDVKDEYI